MILVNGNMNDKFITYLKNEKEKFERLNKKEIHSHNEEVSGNKGVQPPVQDLVKDVDTVVEPQKEIPSVVDRKQDNTVMWM